MFTLASSDKKSSISSLEDDWEAKILGLQAEQLTSYGSLQCQNLTLADFENTE